MQIHPRSPDAEEALTTVQQSVFTCVNASPVWWCVQESAVPGKNQHPLRPPGLCVPMYPRSPFLRRSFLPPARLHRFLLSSQPPCPPLLSPVTCLCLFTATSNGRSIKGTHQSLLVSLCRGRMEPCTHGSAALIIK